MLNDVMQIKESVYLKLLVHSSYFSHKMLSSFIFRYFIKFFFYFFFGDISKTIIVTYCCELAISFLLPLQLYTSSYTRKKLKSFIKIPWGDKIFKCENCKFVIIVGSDCSRWNDPPEDSYTLGSGTKLQWITMGWKLWSWWKHDTNWCFYEKYGIVRLSCTKHRKNGKRFES